MASERGCRSSCFRGGWRVGRQTLMAPRTGARDWAAACGGCRDLSLPTMTDPHSPVDDDSRLLSAAAGCVHPSPAMRAPVQHEAREHDSAAFAADRFRRSYLRLRLAALQQSLHVVGCLLVGELPLERRRVGSSQSSRSTPAGLYRGRHQSAGSDALGQWHCAAACRRPTATARHIDAVSASERWLLDARPPAPLRPAPAR